MHSFSNNYCNKVVVLLCRGEIKAMPFWNCFLEGFAGTVKIISPQKSSPVEYIQVYADCRN